MKQEQEEAGQEQYKVKAPKCQKFEGKPDQDHDVWIDDMQTILEMGHIPEKEKKMIHKDPYRSFRTT